MDRHRKIYAALAKLRSTAFIKVFHSGKPGQGKSCREHLSSAEGLYTLELRKVQATSRQKTAT